MIRRTTKSTRTDTLFPYTTLFRSVVLPAKGGSIRTLMSKDKGWMSRPTSIVTPARSASKDILNIRDMTISRSGHSTRSEEHTSELQSLMRISYAVFCLKKKEVLE